MTTKTLNDYLRHYQKDIDQPDRDPERVIKCLGRLYKLPVELEHLQETGIGRSVNALRKYDGAIGEMSKALVAKWKAMVAAVEAERVSESESEAEEQLPDDPQFSEPEFEKEASISPPNKIHSGLNNKNNFNESQKTLKSSPKKLSQSYKTCEATKENKCIKRKSDVKDVKYHKRRKSNSESDVERSDPSSSSSDEQTVKSGESSDSESSGSSEDKVPIKVKDSRSHKECKSKSSHKSSSYKSEKHHGSHSRSSEQDKKLSKMIKINETTIKKEKVEVSSKSPSKSPKKKPEVIIDDVGLGSGTSFEAALLGLDSPSKSKKKKISKKTESPKSKSHSSKSHSSSRHSRESSSHKKEHSSKRDKKHEESHHSNCKEKGDKSNSKNRSRDLVKIKTEKPDISDLMKEVLTHREHTCGSDSSKLVRRLLDGLTARADKCLAIVKNESFDKVKAVVKSNKFDE